MGTRRPLIVQMVHSPNCDEPQCRLQGACSRPILSVLAWHQHRPCASVCLRLAEEDSDEYGDVIRPASAVTAAIRERTESLLRRTGGTVSAKPIIMRAEFKCATRNTRGFCICDSL